MTRSAVVVSLVVLFLLASFFYRRWRRGLQDERLPHPTVPEHLIEGAERTWVVFATPWCASCGPVAEELKRSDPSARVLTVDATADPDLAGAFHVRSSPTAVLADARGRVQARLVGPAAVADYVRNAQ